MDNLTRAIRRIVGRMGREWFYFRVGHGTYLSFFVSFSQWIVVLFSLYVAQSSLKSLFPSLLGFALTFGVIYVAAARTAGYIHYKKSPFYRGEQEIAVESSPWAYKLQPGRELTLQPYNVLSAELTFRMADKFELWPSPQERREYLEYLRLLRFLKDGGDLRNWTGLVRYNEIET